MIELKSLLELLTLRHIGDSRFEGDSIQFSTQAIFGGQLLAQARYAAATFIA